MTNQVPAVPASPPAAPSALPAIADAGPSLASLRAQDRALQTQLRTLVAKTRELAAQSRVGSGEERAAVRAQLADVGSQVGQVSAELAAVKTQLALQQRTPGAFAVQAPFPPFSPPIFNSDNATAVIIVFFLAVLMPISLAFARRIWRRSAKETPAAHSDMIAPRLERLEQAVDAVAIEIERIAEGQRFLTKVLGSGQGLGVRDAGLAKGAEARVHADPASPLALGGGPIEPVRPAERQPVRPAITPH
jgi:hypothetical protein